jgi:hypothetical protein
MMEFTDQQVQDVYQRCLPEDCGNVPLISVRRIMEAAMALLGDNPETFEKLADEKRWGS